MVVDTSNVYLGTQYLKPTKKNNPHNCPPPCMMSPRVNVLNRTDLKDDATAKSIFEAAQAIEHCKPFQDELYGKVFPSKIALKTHLEAIGRPFGVYFSTTAERVYYCSRFGTPKSASTQIRNSRSLLPCNCPVRCHFTYTIKSYLDPEKLLAMDVETKLI
jgi:hypothetical protein